MEMKRTPPRLLLLMLIAIGVSYASVVRLKAKEAGNAGRPLEDADCTLGGITVLVGLDDIDSLLNMPVQDVIVHALDTDPAKVAAARRALSAAGKYGKISVAQFDGKLLPYIDNAINTVLVKNAAGLRNEIDRVLLPGGTCIADGKKTIKPIPVDTDEWTHYLYNPGNNAVSRDKVVAPPRRIQWVAGPRYSRHHDKMSSINAVVSAGGKVFTIVDEGPAWSILMPPKWMLTARDAYNGKLLWKRPIETWSSHLQGLKSGPASLPRRLVAVGDKVYATLGLDAPVEQISAATGRTLQRYEGTMGTTEILVADGVCYTVCGALPGGRWFTEGDRTIAAVDIRTGAMRWQKRHWVVPGTLAVLGERLYFYEKDRVTCKKSATGETVWQSEPVPRPKNYISRYMPTLVATEDVVLIAGGEGASTGGWSSRGAKDTITALNSKTGDKLWDAHHPDSGYSSPEDVFVIDGKVWFGDSRDGAKKGNTYGLDLMTGEVKVKFAPDRDIYFFHHRCYRGKATENYVLTSRAGIEFIDFRKQHWEMNHWVRGACLYGIVPAHGLIYAPQHPCACYLEAKLDGFNALAPANGPRLPAVLPPRLEKGKAYGSKTGNRAPESTAWPTYRHDVKRSGSSDKAVAGGLTKTFTVAIGGRITAPVVANDLLIVAAMDRHAVNAYDAATGTEKWRYIAGGAVDSPPTIYGQLVLFGCRDGYVYCLRASDGELVWRFRAAPIDQRLISFEHLESVWPVHGSILVREGVAYAVAGRSSFLDGGLRLVRLDPATGKLLNETIMDGYARVDGKDLQDYVSWLNMPVAKPDILSCMGDHVYMRSQAFTPDATLMPLKAKPTSGNADAGAPPPRQDPAYKHLFSPTGFTDGEGWHRTYWLFGSDFYSGWCGYFTAGKATPAGKIMVFDDDKVYGFGRREQYWRWTVPMQFHFFAASHAKVGAMDLSRKRRGKETAEKASSYLWSKNYPVFARAMCKAGDTIYVAGPRDISDGKSVKVTPEMALQQVDHWQGRKGGVLLALSAKTGEQESKLDLSGVPVFDGMIAASGGLYVSTTSGDILFLKGTEKQ
jgi:outer membrane protein assembly factor BamB